MAEGVTFYDGADQPTNKIPEDLSPSEKMGSGPIDFYDGADKVGGASVPTNPKLNTADVKVGKGNPVTGPMDK